MVFPQPSQLPMLSHVQRPLVPYKCSKNQMSVHGFLTPFARPLSASLISFLVILPLIYQFPDAQVQAHCGGFALAFPFAGDVQTFFPPIHTWRPPSHPPGFNTNTLSSGSPSQHQPRPTPIVPYLISCHWGPSFLISILASLCSHLLHPHLE